MAFAYFQANFTQAWQTFSIVSTLALAGLAFTGQIKANAHSTSTWPASVVRGRDDNHPLRMASIKGRALVGLCGCRSFPYEADRVSNRNVFAAWN